MNSQEYKIEPLSSKEKKVIGTTLIIIAIWVIAGFSAFIASIVCMARGGPTSLKVIGFLLALIVGPFYWIYFALAKSYCVKE